MSARRPDPLYVPDVSENTWRLDPRHSKIGFRVRSLYRLRAIRGEFREFDGTLDLRRDPAIELAVNAASLTTGNPRHDRRLLSADFLNTEQQPTITFISTDVTLQSETLTVRGELIAAAHKLALELTVPFRHEEGELVLDASVMADHRAMGITRSALGSIRRHTELSAQARLIRE
jgi:polyisoprenoid-binding protein YceI